MWRFVVSSVAGPAHIAEGNPCQDFGCARVAGSTDHQALVACVADGAGSAEFGGEGAAIACQTIVNRASLYYETCRSLERITQDDIRQWCDEARQQIGVEVAARRRTPRDYATTVCGAIIAPEQAVFFQVGDGGMIVRCNGALGVVFWPQIGEYANTTNFITSDKFEQYLEYVYVPTPVRDVALFTDGIQRLALSFHNQIPFPPFFTPLFGVLQRTPDFDRLTDDLRQFLESPSMRTRSDDDKTLIIASRIS